MQHNRIVSREEWLVARKQHLSKEKEFTRLRDELSRQRRELPWVRVEKRYVFDGPNGKETLADLVPKGRDEDALAFTMAWVRHHDRYGDDYFVDPTEPYLPPKGSDCSCGSGEDRS